MIKMPETLSEFIDGVLKYRIDPYYVFSDGENDYDGYHFYWECRATGEEYPQDVEPPFHLTYIGDTAYDPKRKIVNGQDIGENIRCRWWKDEEGNIYLSMGMGGDEFGGSTGYYKVPNKLFAENNQFDVK